ncbi:MAG: NAD(P)-dependent oxidoreductase [Duncaniella sp.]|uniref:NAD(P)-dependent oxidoreductase n=1 Tax=Duncaniella sp. TaxID=2518496 RepID=UPI0019CD7CAA|nr:NAD(P)-dependent oxidoreductase [Duncaniella sp.]MBD5313048.1 NAD(P)-dependent oxidoreductase [Bacteroides sp.]MDE6089439.1 NAD(P)-dependent oxidoreductase [Duncaniella sp.]
MNRRLNDSASEGYTMLEAINEAKRCLHCKNPLCKKGCPISQDIPDWIHELSMGNLGNAMSIINAKSNLPAVCGRVCAHERQCEGNCILNKKNAHINIGKLERFVADFDSVMSLTHEHLVPKTRGRVAVIGSGPAGLTVAGELSRKGFDVEIFEMEPDAGGVLMFGIPEYRLPKDVVRHEIKKISELGVRVHCNVTIGRDYTVDDLFAQGFDAIFMGTGAGKPKKLSIPGNHFDGVRQAIYFLRRVSLYNSGLIGRDEIPVKEGDRVYVIGCGNTAMDAARTALRMDAKSVTVVYHRSIEKMSALRAEYDEAVEEGVEFMWNSSITEIRGEDGQISEVVIDREGETITLPANKVIMAVGSQPASRIVSTTEGIKVDEKGYVLARENPYGMTSRKGVFAGGDVTNRPATVVHAMQDAQKVAEGIMQYVDAIKLMAKIDSEEI